MDNPAASAVGLNVEQLLQLHTLTKEVAKVCQRQLRGYLDSMALLLRPRRILGDAMEGAERESVGDSDRTPHRAPRPVPQYGPARSYRPCSPEVGTASGRPCSHIAASLRKAPEAQTNGGTQSGNSGCPGTT